MEKLANYIDGQLEPPRSGRYLDNHEPATGRVVSQVPSSDAADLDAAVASGQSAFAQWSRVGAEERSRVLMALAARIDANLEELAQAESKDTGKPVSLARALDIPRASSNLRFFAAAATQFASESHSMENGAINYTLRQPHGVVATISPWNLPLYLFTWKIAPALAAGNAVIAKPSELTPLTAYLFSKICQDVGLPNGVLNILHGEGATIGQKIVEHPEITAISFTGGTLTGATVARTAGPMFKKVSLELGGKNPTMVFADADWESALEGSIKAAFSNQGEICLCGSRILVESSVYDRFRDAFVERARALRLGDPLEASTQQGAVVSEAHMKKILGCLDLAKEEGGRILCGGKRRRVDSDRCKDGWFVEPTVIEGLSMNCRTNREEIFGPVATLIPFDTEDEALGYANATEYGLSSSIWSQDVSRCHRIAERIHSGLVWINTWLLRDLRTPMGGMKQSGVGREGGFEALRFFTEPKNVCIKYG
jgi:aminomuconate-semialdehyde/2-hydroxymuconate-6-semialdehyde dehydrogenase